MQNQLLTKEIEERAILSCLMTDGPSCFPFDKYHGHSKVLYANDEQINRDPTEFGRLWKDAESRLDKYMV